MTKRRRQAIVVIHGIGEQRPMTTLRGFVTSLLNHEKIHLEDYSTDRTFWTKPDRVSNSYEMRKISAKGRSDKRSTTHFYEYHWAANMRDTKWQHILSWFWSLMFRSPLQSPSMRLRLLWAFLWFIFISWGVITYQFVIDWLEKGVDPFSGMTIYRGFFLALPILFFILHNIFIGFIGDAARYLRVHVDNIHQREQIRKQGIELLKALHKTEDYDRIILVGHSLGSVIAYDIITYLWIEFNKSIHLGQKEKFKETPDNDWNCSFGGVSRTSQELKNIADWSLKAQAGEFTPDDAIELQKDQSKLWQKIQYERKSWLITDLVTIGSPLTHAKLLMADSLKDFKLRIAEREYPMSPPTLDGQDLTYPSGSGSSFLHHATPFSVTRWSNIYYKGDFIGGKLASNFGPGIVDIETSYAGSTFKRIWSKISPLSHIRYWINEYTDQPSPDRKEAQAIKQLYEIMRLNDLEQDIYPTE